MYEVIFLRSLYILYSNPLILIRWPQYRLFPGNFPIISEYLQETLFVEPVFFSTEILDWRPVTCEKKGYSLSKVFLKFF